MNGWCGTDGLKISIDPKTLLDSTEVVMSPHILPDEAKALIDICKEILEGIRSSNKLTPFKNCSWPAPGTRVTVSWLDVVSPHQRISGKTR